MKLVCEVWHGFWYTFIPLITLLLILEWVTLESCISR